MRNCEIDIATECVLVQRIKFWVLARLLPILVFVIVLDFVMVLVFYPVEFITSHFAQDLREAFKNYLADFAR